MALNAKVKNKDYSQYTLIKNAIHNPDEPRHFMTVGPIEKRYAVFADKTKIADAAKCWVMHEVAHIIINPVYYFHKQDVCTEWFAPSLKVTTCPLKGKASYFHLNLEGEIFENAAWCYEDVIPEASAIKGLIAFDTRYVDIKCVSKS